MMTVQDRTQPLRVAFQTLGCRLNQYDTEALKLALGAARPIAVVPWEDEADLYLVNSCTVTGKADRECRRLVRRVRRRRPEARVVVVGCYAQAQPAALAGLAALDGVVGNTARDEVRRWLPDVLARPAGSGRPFVLVEDYGRRPAFAAPLVGGFPGRSRATIKVQDGCDLRCSYCLVWQARGPGRSRPVAAVLDQIARLHEERGYNELVLAGVHLGSWGRDLAPTSRGLPDLLAAVARRFPALRVRLSSIHPQDVTAPLVAHLGEGAPLRPHLHLSLQSGSDRILALMRRPYRAAQVEAAIRAAIAVAPDCGLGADVIGGFPGETAADFAETARRLEDLPFGYLHVFRFSPRPGTPAAALAPVAPEAVRERAEVLRDLGRRKRAAFGRALVGTVREAVVERGSAAAPNRRAATTDNYALVRVESELPAGTLVAIACDGWRDGGLQGRITRVLREVAP